MTIIGMHRDVPASPCLHCDRINDNATGVGIDAAPEPGDYAVCLYCGHVMAYADDLVLRELNDAEMVDAAGNKTILEIQRARRGTPR